MNESMEGREDPFVRKL